MLFKDKYPNAKEDEIIRKDSLLVAQEEKSCIMCGTNTKFIDFCFEARFCSEECVGELLCKCL